MANPFVHVELNTENVAQGKKFYSQLFDWKLEDTDMGVDGEYTLIDPRGGTGGGMFAMRGVSMWLPYVQVDDIKESTAKARKLGAKIKRDVSEVQQMGWLSIIEDPTGAMLGLWQPKSMSETRGH